MPEIPVRRGPPITVTEDQLAMIPPDSLPKWTWRGTASKERNRRYVAYYDRALHMTISLTDVLLNPGKDRSLVPVFPDGVTRYDTARIISKKGGEWKAALKKRREINEKPKPKKGPRAGSLLNGCRIYPVYFESSKIPNRCIGVDPLCAHYESCLDAIRNNATWAGWTSNGQGFIEADPILIRAEAYLKMESALGEVVS